jgi:hypothetical protein
LQELLTKEVVVPLNWVDDRFHRRINPSPFSFGSFPKQEEAKELSGDVVLESWLATTDSGRIIKITNTICNVGF